MEALSTVLVPMDKFSPWPVIEAQFMPPVCSPLSTERHVPQSCDSRPMDSSTPPLPLPVPLFRMRCLTSVLQASPPTFRSRLRWHSNRMENSSSVDDSP